MEKACERTVESLAGRWMAAAWLPVAAYMALIFYLSSLPHPDEQLPKFLFETLGDKLLHFIEYAVRSRIGHSVGPPGRMRRSTPSSSPPPRRPSME